MDFESFILEAKSLADEIVSAELADEKAYLGALDEILGKVHEIPKVPIEPAQKEGKNWGWATLIDAMPLYGIQLNINPGGGLPSHNHEGYIGLLHVVEGQIKITSYNQESCNGNRLILSKSNEVVLGSRESSFVFSSAENIHRIEDLGRGSVLIDVLTIFRGNGESYEVVIDELPLEGGFYYATRSETKL